MHTEIIANIFGFILALVAVGGGVFALFKEKEIVNTEGQHVAVEINNIGKFKSNYPSLGAIALGLLLGYFVVSGLRDIEPTVPLVAKLSVIGAQDGTPVIVGAIPVSYFASSNAMDSENVNEVKVFVAEPGDYSVIAYTVRGVRSTGETVYSVAHGPANRSVELGTLGFTGTLYVDKRLDKDEE